MSSRNDEDLTGYELDDVVKRIGALNLDWTKRNEKVDTQAKLAIGVRESLVSIDSPSIVSFSEVSGEGWSKKFKRETTYTGASVNGPYGRGFMYTAWKRDEFFHEETIQSKGKRYTGVLLVDKKSKKRHLHIGVHMPTKGGIWKVNADAISRCVEDYCTKKDGVDFVSIAGDFNASPFDVVKHFAPDGLNFALTSQVFLPTTTAGNSIDNVLSSQEFNIESIIIDSKNNRFTHYPIAATTKK